MAHAPTLAASNVEDACGQVGKEFFSRSPSWVKPLVSLDACKLSQCILSRLWRVSTSPTRPSEVEETQEQRRTNLRNICRRSSSSSGGKEICQRHKYPQFWRSATEEQYFSVLIRHCVWAVLDRRLCAVEWEWERLMCRMILRWPRQACKRPPKRCDLAYNFGRLLRRFPLRWNVFKSTDLS